MGRRLAMAMLALAALTASAEAADVTHFTGPRRNLRVSVRIPRRIRRLPRSPLPVIVRIRARDLNRLARHKQRWVIERPR